MTTLNLLGKVIGGSGGVVRLLYQTFTGSAPVVAGGAGGAGIGTGNPGFAGSAGRVFNLS